MTAKNISLDRYKQRFFGDFLELPGLTEVAVNRPGELYTKINGVWKQHAVPLSYEDCYNFARCLAKHHGDNIEDIKPGCQPRWNLANGAVIVPRPVSAIRCLSPSVSYRRYKSRISHTSMRTGNRNRRGKTETHDEELIALYNTKIFSVYGEMRRVR
ncbi:hypothetical protein BANRA_04853 [Escherichia coli]|nr:hypothetical protein BANRA_04853 [Escherichia coli]